MKKTYNKKTFNGGNLKQFESFLDKQINHKSNFKVVSSGLSRTIIFDSGIKFRYFSKSKYPKPKKAKSKKDKTASKKENESKTCKIENQ